MTIEPPRRPACAFRVFDPRPPAPPNPRQSAFYGRQRSVVTTRGWKEAAHLRAPQGARGRIETITWKSELVDDELEVQVYLPAGYDETEDRFPLLLFYHGDEALEWGKIDHTLDNLIGESVAPLIVAFLPEVDVSGSEAVAKLGQALEQELLPTLDGRYRTRARPEDRAMMGNHFAGWSAFHVVLLRPDLFRKAATQSSIYSNWGRVPMLELIEKSSQSDGVPPAPLPGYDFVIEWTDHEYRDREGLTPGQLLEQALVKQGYQPVTHQIPGGPGWGTWRQTTGRILETLFPHG